MAGKTSFSAKYQDFCHSAVLMSTDTGELFAWYFITPFTHNPPPHLFLRQSYSCLKVEKNQFEPENMLCIIQHAGGQQIPSFMYTMGRIHSPLKLFRSECMVPCTAGLRLSCRVVAFLCFFVVPQVLSVQSATVATYLVWFCLFIYHFKRTAVRDYDPVCVEFFTESVHLFTQLSTL